MQQPQQVDNGIHGDAPSEAMCGAEALQGLVGQSTQVLQTMKFGSEVRFLPPGAIMTKDFKLQRLNIFSNAAGMISEVNCG